MPWRVAVVCAELFRKIEIHDLRTENKPVVMQIFVSTLYDDSPAVDYGIKFSVIRSTEVILIKSEHIKRTSLEHVHKIQRVPLFLEDSVHHIILRGKLGERLLLSVGEGKIKISRKRDMAQRKNVHVAVISVSHFNLQFQYIRLN